MHNMIFPNSHTRTNNKIIRIMTMTTRTTTTVMMIIIKKRRTLPRKKKYSTS